MINKNNNIVKNNEIKRLPLKSDYVFKRIFGYKGNEEITKNFISCIINENIQEIELDTNPILEKDLIDDKIGILDIKAKLDNNINCDIEMQLIDRKHIEKRILYYWSKMYTKSIKAGQDYNKLQKAIVILISDYNLENLKEIKKYITNWKIREEDNPKCILTNMLTFYIIELDKYKKYVKNNKNIKLNSWIEFIQNPNEVNGMSNKEIKKAKEVLEEISQDEREIYLAELREKYIMDQKAIEDAGYDKGLKAGITQGIKQGMTQGIKYGISQTQKDIVKKMLNKNFDKNTIHEITGLSVEEITNIEKQ